MKIEVNAVTKKFKETTIIDNVTANFESGKIYGLIGKNGSGKSVLLKMICGFYCPTEGEILFDGENFIKQKRFPPNTGALIERPGFIGTLTGLENLILLAKIQNKIKKEDIYTTLKQVNLYDEKDKLFSKYSLGMKQKLGIAQAIMENPDIIILDEPFNGIEDDTAEELRNLLLELKKQNKLIILATHIKDDIDKIVDVVYKLNVGKLEIK